MYNAFNDFRLEWMEVDTVVAKRWSLQPSTSTKHPLASLDHSHIPALDPEETSKTFFRAVHTEFRRRQGWFHFPIRL